MPKVSVIIPAYNSEKYLAQSVESVLHQTYRDYEIIIVDDGSTDSTRRIAQRYADGYPAKVTCLSQENRGPGAARNNGIMHARGAYIAFLDADDLWMESKLEKQAAVLDRRPEAGMVYSDLFFIDKRDRPVMRRTFRGYELPEGDITLFFFSRYFMFTSTVMVRRACADRVGAFREDITIGEDYDYLLRLSAVCRAYPVKEQLLGKRSLRNSLSSIDWKLNVRNDLIVLGDFIRNNPVFFKRHRKTILLELAQRCLSLGYWLTRGGERASALRYLMKAFRYDPSLKPLKCMMQLALPRAMMRFLRGLLRGEEPVAAEGRETELEED